ncbi:YihY/virulence factor BrkB family protein [Alteriqipengyuania lutimaris]|uniref:YihY/virulence factor BrkB family protein n=1 Tax=Alteriqipengyuania lutimaris TaxID=1538146 RepID=A0A395LIJ5_9SPHN|nr:YihY/virulence factor BrkB family protein [Alteriqipengyuania lutimaris]MBB3034334.1 membrane protein [Alteriqipengyuania lutimaris]RDS76763.1 YihY/virulence factor BrkB family protein [Alteriqipengyuania lutimaris]
MRRLIPRIKQTLPDSESRVINSLTPEDRRREAVALRSGLRGPSDTQRRSLEVARRVVVGTFNDGFLYAGNIAYMSMLAIFPFFITGAAIFAALGEGSDRAASINAILLATPPVVAEVIEPVARNVIESRQGWLLWVGGAVGLWTVGSLIETIRDLLRRSYGTEPTQAFWLYRLASTAMIIGAVILLMFSLIAQVMIGAAQQVIGAYFPLLSDALAKLALARFVPGFGLFGSIYALFYILTPGPYRQKRYPKWPGAVATTLWWVGVTVALPPVLRSFFAYNLTYGSLAGIIITLLFFWLVGLGLVIGAQLNAALAETPEEERLSRTGGEPRIAPEALAYERKEP